MLKIGEFSKLSHLTVKALRFYEKEGLLIPAFIDSESGYRFYETGQLAAAAKIKGYRQLGLTIEEIRAIRNEQDARRILLEKSRALKAEQEAIAVRLSIIHHILEDEEMKYQVTEKTIPACTVYRSEAVLPRYADIMEWIPAQGAECAALNPQLKCAQPPYEFCEYPDGEHKDADIRVRHSEAVTEAGRESENIRFCTIPETRVISVYHKGPYEQIGEAYAFLFRYAEENGYEIAGLSRESYIDGIWNRESPEDWLTEIQLPIK